MEQRVIIHPNQQVTDTDLNNVGEFARASLDHVVADGIEPGRKFWGFPVTATGPLELRSVPAAFTTKARSFFATTTAGLSSTSPTISRW